MRLSAPIEGLVPDAGSSRMSDKQNSASDAAEAERLAEELKQQVQLARDRVSDRYAKLIEGRSFESGRAGSGQPPKSRLPDPAEVPIAPGDAESD
jgi:hypothetical protein